MVFNKKEFDKLMQDDNFKAIREDNKKIRKGFPLILEHIAFCAGTQTGKTYLALALLTDIYKDFYDQVFIFTCNKNNDFLRVLDLDPENIIVKPSFEEIVELSDEIGEMFKEESGEISTLFLFDDMGAIFRTWGKDGSLFADFLMDVRHKGICCWVLEQNPRFISPAMRSNMLCSIIWPTLSTEELDSSGKSTLGCKKLARNIEYVREINEAIENPYGCCYWRRKNESFDKCYYMYIADDGVQIFPLTDDLKEMEEYLEKQVSRTDINKQNKIEEDSDEEIEEVVKKLPKKIAETSKPYQKRKMPPGKELLFIL